MNGKRIWNMTRFANCIDEKREILMFLVVPVGPVPRDDKRTVKTLLTELWSEAS